MAAFRWTSQTTEAAQLVADAELNYPQIAEKVGVARETLYNWRQKPEFLARVREHVEEFREHVRRRGIADRERRVDALHDRWRKLQKIIEARALAYAKDAHGADTGLLCQTIRWEGKGDDARAVIEYELDAALLRELREHEKQAAQELGQWSEKREVSGPDGGPISLTELSTHDLNALGKIARKLDPG